MVLAPLCSIPADNQAADTYALRIEKKKKTGKTSSYRLLMKFTSEENGETYLTLYVKMNGFKISL